MNVVILSSQMLFAEAIVNRLRQYLRQVELKIIDPRQPDILDQIVSVQPDVVILDVTDCERTELCSLVELLFSFSKLKIIHLDLHHEHIQVITSEQRAAGRVRDLAEMIESPF